MEEQKKPELRPGRRALKYTELYHPETYTDAKGRERTCLRYTGPWTTAAEQGRSGKARILLSGACMLLVLAALILIQTFRHSSYGCWYVNIPLAVALFPGAYGTLGLIDLPWKLQPISRGRYMQGVVRVLRSSLAVLILSGAALLIGEPVCRAVSGDWIFLREDIRFMLLAFAAATLSAAVIFLLRGLDFHEIPNEAYDPDKEKNSAGTP